MRYPVVIHKEKDSAYGVTVPDIPGCFSAGDTIDEAMENVREAIYAHLELVTTNDGDIADAHPIEEHQANPDFAGGTWALVDVDIDDLLGPAERVNVTIPRRVLQKIDTAATFLHMNRSSLLTKGALDLIAVSAGKGSMYKVYSVKAPNPAFARAVESKARPAEVFEDPSSRASRSTEKRQPAQRKAARSHLKRKEA